MRLLIVLIIIMASFNLPGQQNVSLQKRVYICVSGTAYAYHDNIYCRGLRSCTHKIDTVDLKTAITKFKRKPCGYCY